MPDENPPAERDTHPRKMSVTVTKDGPYAVAGGPPLSKQSIGSDREGESVEWLPGEITAVGTSYFLCRCGQSARKPFCDGSHIKVGFNGEETASREPYAAQAKEIVGPALALTDAESLCAFARFCDRDGQVWTSVSLARTSSAREAFARQVGQCPSGRLVAWDLATGKPIEPQLPPSIVLVEDPKEAVSGPVWVRGGIEIIAADGTAYEVRNRVTLCRCGRSSNKPFCDGTHASVGFTDQ
jgi:CDGSH-type Zn-finger protein